MRELLQDLLKTVIGSKKDRNNLEQLKLFVIPAIKYHIEAVKKDCRKLISQYKGIIPTVAKTVRTKLSKDPLVEYLYLGIYHYTQFFISIFLKEKLEDLTYKTAIKILCFCLFLEEKVDIWIKNASL